LLHRVAPSDLTLTVQAVRHWRAATSIAWRTGGRRARGTAWRWRELTTLLVASAAVAFASLQLHSGHQLRATFRMLVEHNERRAKTSMRRRVVLRWRTTASAAAFAAWAAWARRRWMAREVAERLVLAERVWHAQRANDAGRRQPAGEAAAAMRQRQAAWLAVRRWRQALHGRRLLLTVASRVVASRCGASFRTWVATHQLQRRMAAVAARWSPAVALRAAVGAWRRSSARSRERLDHLAAVVARWRQRECGAAMRTWRQHASAIGLQRLWLDRGGVGSDTAARRGVLRRWRLHARQASALRSVAFAWSGRGPPPPRAARSLRRWRLEADFHGRAATAARRGDVVRCAACAQQWAAHAHALRVADAAVAAWHPPAKMRGALRAWRRRLATRAAKAETMRVVAARWRMHDAHEALGIWRRHASWLALLLLWISQGEADAAAAATRRAVRRWRQWAEGVSAGGALLGVAVHWRQTQLLRHAAHSWAAAARVLKRVLAVAAHWSPTAALRATVAAWRRTARSQLERLGAMQAVVAKWRQRECAAALRTWRQHASTIGLQRLWLDRGGAGGDTAARRNALRRWRRIWRAQAALLGAARKWHAAAAHGALRRWRAVCDGGGGARRYDSTVTIDGAVLRRVVWRRWAYLSRQNRATLDAATLASSKRQARDWRAAYFGFHRWAADAASAVAFASAAVEAGTMFVAAVGRRLQVALLTWGVQATARHARWASAVAASLAFGRRRRRRSLRSWAVSAAGRGALLGSAAAATSAGDRRTLRRILWRWWRRGALARRMAHAATAKAIRLRVMRAHAAWARRTRATSALHAQSSSLLTAVAHRRVSKRWAAWAAWAAAEAAFGYALAFAPIHAARGGRARAWRVWQRTTERKTRRGRDRSTAAQPRRSTRSRSRPRQSQNPQQQMLPSHQPAVRRSSRKPQPRPLPSWDGGTGDRAQTALVCATRLVIGIRGWQRAAARLIQARLARGGRYVPASSRWQFVVLPPSASSPLRQIQPMPAPPPPVHVGKSAIASPKSPKSPKSPRRPLSSPGASGYNEAPFSLAALLRRGGMAHARTELARWRRHAVEVSMRLNGAFSTAGARLMGLTRQLAWRRWRTMAGGAGLMQTAVRAYASRALRVWRTVTRMAAAAWLLSGRINMGAWLSRWKRALRHAAERASRRRALQARVLHRPAWARLRALAHRATRQREAQLQVLGSRLRSAWQLWCGKSIASVEAAAAVERGDEAPQVDWLLRAFERTVAADARAALMSDSASPRTISLTPDASLAGSGDGGGGLAALHERRLASVRLLIEEWRRRSAAGTLRPRLWQWVQATALARGELSLLHKRHTRVQAWRRMLRDLLRHRRAARCEARLRCHAALRRWCVAARPRILGVHLARLRDVRWLGRAMQSLLDAAAAQRVATLLGTSTSLHRSGWRRWLAWWYWQSRVEATVWSAQRLTAKRGIARAHAAWRDGARRSARVAALCRGAVALMFASRLGPAWRTWRAAWGGTLQASFLLRSAALLRLRRCWRRLRLHTSQNGALRATLAASTLDALGRWAARDMIRAFGIWSRDAAVVNAWLAGSMARWARQQAAGWACWVAWMQRRAAAAAKVAGAVARWRMQGCVAALAALREAAEARRALGRWAARWRQASCYGALVWWRRVAEVRGVAASSVHRGAEVVARRSVRVAFADLARLGRALAYGRKVVARWSLLGVAWAFGLLRETAETHARLKQVMFRWASGALGGAVLTWRDNAVHLRTASDLVHRATAHRRRVACGQTVALLAAAARVQRASLAVVARVVAAWSRQAVYAAVLRWRDDCRLVLTARAHWRRSCLASWRREHACAVAADAVARTVVARWRLSEVSAALRRWREWNVLLLAARRVVARWRASAVAAAFGSWSQERDRYRLMRATAMRWQQPALRLAFDRLSSLRHQPTAPPQLAEDLIEAATPILRRQLLLRSGGGGAAATPGSARLSLLAATLHAWREHRLMLLAAQQLVPFATGSWGVASTRRAFGIWARDAAVVNAWLAGSMARWARQQAAGWACWVAWMQRRAAAAAKVAGAVARWHSQGVVAALLCWRRVAETRSEAVSAVRRGAEVVARRAVRVAFVEMARLGRALAYGRKVVTRWSLLGVAWAFGLLRELAETKARVKRVVLRWASGAVGAAMLRWFEASVRLRAASDLVHRAWEHCRRQACARCVAHLSALSASADDGVLSLLLHRFTRKRFRTQLTRWRTAHATDLAYLTTLSDADRHHRRRALRTLRSRVELQLGVTTAAMRAVACWQRREALWAVRQWAAAVEKQRAVLAVVVRWQCASLAAALEGWNASHVAAVAARAVAAVWQNARLARACRSWTEFVADARRDAAVRKLVSAALGALAVGKTPVRRKPSHTSPHAAKLRLLQRWRGKAARLRLLEARAVSDWARAQLVHAIGAWVEDGAWRARVQRVVAQWRNGALAAALRAWAEEGARWRWLRGIAARWQRQSLARGLLRWVEVAQEMAEEETGMAALAALQGAVATVRSCLATWKHWWRLRGLARAALLHGDFANLQQARLSAFGKWTALVVWAARLVQARHVGWWCAMSQTLRKWAAQAEAARQVVRAAHSRAVLALSGAMRWWAASGELRRQLRGRLSLALHAWRLSDVGRAWRTLTEAAAWRSLSWPAAWRGGLRRKAEALAWWRSFAAAAPGLLAVAAARWLRLHLRRAFAPWWEKTRNWRPLIAVARKWRGGLALRLLVRWAARADEHGIAARERRRKLCGRRLLRALHGAGVARVASRVGRAKADRRRLCGAVAAWLRLLRRAITWHGEAIVADSQRVTRAKASVLRRLRTRVTSAEAAAVAARRALMCWLHRELLWGLWRWRSAWFRARRKREVTETVLGRWRRRDANWAMRRWHFAWLSRIRRDAAATEHAARLRRHRLVTALARCRAATLQADQQSGVLAGAMLRWRGASLRSCYDEWHRFGGVQRALAARSVGAARRWALHVARGSWQRWRSHAAEVRSVAAAVARWQNGAICAAIYAWRRGAAAVVALATLERAARRWTHLEAAAALAAWHGEAEALRERLEAEIRCELVPARRALTQLARHAAWCAKVAPFIGAWRLPQLSAAHSAWREWCEERHMAHTAASTAAVAAEARTRRIATACLAAWAAGASDARGVLARANLAWAWRSWAHGATASRARATALARMKQVVAVLRASSLAAAWRGWAEFSTTRKAQLWLLRRAATALVARDKHCSFVRWRAEARARRDAIEVTTAHEATAMHHALSARVGDWRRHARWQAQGTAAVRALMGRFIVRAWRAWRERCDEAATARKLATLGATLRSEGERRASMAALGAWRVRFSRAAEMAGLALRWLRARSASDLAAGWAQWVERGTIASFEAHILLKAEAGWRQRQQSTQRRVLGRLRVITILCRLGRDRAEVASGTGEMARALARWLLMRRRWAVNAAWWRSLADTPEAHCRSRSLLTAMALIKLAAGAQPIRSGAALRRYCVMLRSALRMWRREALLRRTVTRWAPDKAWGWACWVEWRQRRAAAAATVASAVARWRMQGCVAALAALREAAEARARLKQVVFRWASGALGAAVLRWREHATDARAASHLLRRGLALVARWSLRLAFAEMARLGRALAYGRVVVGRWSLLGVAWAFGLLRETAETHARLKQVMYRWASGALGGAVLTWREHAASANAASDLLRRGQALAARWSLRLAFVEMARLGRVLAHGRVVMDRWSSVDAAWAFAALRAAAETNATVRRVALRWASGALGGAVVRWRDLVASGHAALGLLRQGGEHCRRRMRGRSFAHLAATTRAWQARLEVVARVVAVWSRQAVHAALRRWSEGCRSSLAAHALVVKVVARWRLSEVGAGFRLWQQVWRELQESLSAARRALARWMGSAVAYAFEGWVEAAQATAEWRARMLAVLTALRAVPLVRAWHGWALTAARSARAARLLSGATHAWAPGGPRVLAAWRRWRRAVAVAAAAVAAAEATAAAEAAWSAAEAATLQRRVHESLYLWRRRCVAVRAAVRCWRNSEVAAGWRQWRRMTRTATLVGSALRLGWAATRRRTLRQAVRRWGAIARPAAAAAAVEADAARGVRLTYFERRMRRAWLRWLARTVRMIGTVRRVMTAVHRWRGGALGAALALWMVTAACGAVEARGALQWEARGAPAAATLALARWRVHARRSKRLAVLLELAGRYHGHRATFDSFRRLGENSLSSYLAAHRLAVACMRWGGGTAARPPAGRARGGGGGGSEAAAAAAAVATAMREVMDLEVVEEDVDGGYEVSDQAMQRSAGAIEADVLRKLRF